MANYEEAKVKLTDCQLNKLKSILKKNDNNKEKLSRWRIAPWIISENQEKNKIRNNFANYISAQLCKII